MKSFPSKPFTVLLATLLTSLASAQDLGGIGTGSSPAPSSPSGATPGIIRASRFTLANRNAVLAAIQPRLSMTNRQTDPFGLPQNPEAPKPVQPKQVQEATPVAVRTPLSQALQGMNVNMVMPSRGSFMIGANTVRVGQTLSLKRGETTYKAMVEKIDARAITFRDIETKETAELLLDLLPSQMQKGQNASESVPGMQRANDPGTIDLDAPSSK